MAARKNPLHPIKVEEMRQKIRATLLIKRLEDHALTSLSDKNYAKSAMSDSQVRAALGLLKKIVPDVSSMTVAGDPDKPLAVSVVTRRVIDPANGRASN